MGTTSKNKDKRKQLYIHNHAIIGVIRILFYWFADSNLDAYSAYHTYRKPIINKETGIPIQAGIRSETINRCVGLMDDNSPSSDGTIWFSSFAHDLS